MKENGSTFSFGTDFHGNLKNIREFLRISQERQVNHVVFGGDISPKKMAIELEGGQAFTFSGLGSSAMGTPPPFDYATAEHLHETGYMLFKDKTNPEKIEILSGLVSKLQDMAGLNEKARYQSSSHALSDKELDFMEKEILPLLKKAVRNDSVGRDIVRRIIQELWRVQPRYTIDRVFDDLLLKSKIDTFERRGLTSDPAGRSQVLFGHPEATDAQFKATYRRGSNFMSINLSHLYHWMVTAISPWIKWEETRRQLLKYSVPKQRAFLRELLKEIRQFRQSFAGSVSMILGNDDALELKGDLDKADYSGHIHHATNRVIQLDDETQLIGYSCVPPIENTLYDAWYREEVVIKKELEELLQRTKGGIKTILNAHCPPARTTLCKAIVPSMDQTDFGSESIRDFIQQTQPTVALTGHIHKSWKVTGQVHDRIGSSMIFNPGDSEYEPHFIVGNLDKPEQFEWIKPDDND